MNFEQYEKYEQCLVNLVKCAILKRNTYHIPEDIDIDMLIAIAKRHKILNLIYPILSLTGHINSEIEKGFGICVIVETKQLYYLEKIKKRFEEEKIRFVCMKGAYLKTLYPESYMRSSTDLDIFVDDENTDKVHDIMTELGFTAERFSHQIQDDVYVIGNFVHIEIHRKLISNKCPWDEKCQDIVNRIVPKEEGSYEYVMTTEDFYLHMIGHMAKHMKYSGFGIRMLIDVWVYLNRFQDEIDRKVLDERLKDCGLDTFEKEIVKLVDYWFNEKPGNEKTKELGRYVIESGLFGSLKQYKATEMTENMGNTQSVRKSIIKKMTHALFLPYKNMCLIYPQLSKYPVLLPFFWIYRAMKIVLFKRDSIVEETKTYDNVDVDYAKNVAELKKNLGL